ncbi:conserved protein of unknown function [Streptomyces murinus]
MQIMCPRACTMAVTPMEQDAVKWLPVARRFRYAADTHPDGYRYDMCTAATGS